MVHRDPDTGQFVPDGKGTIPASNYETLFFETAWQHDDPDNPWDNKQQETQIDVPDGFVIDLRRVYAMGNDNATTGNLTGTTNNARLDLWFYNDSPPGGVGDTDPGFDGRVSDDEFLTAFEWGIVRDSTSGWALAPNPSLQVTDFPFPVVNPDGTYGMSGEGSNGGINAFGEWAIWVFYDFVEVGTDELMLELLRRR